MILNKIVNFRSSFFSLYLLLFILYIILHCSMIARCFHLVHVGVFNVPVPCIDLDFLVKWGLSKIFFWYLIYITGRIYTHFKRGDEQGQDKTTAFIYFTQFRWNRKFLGEIWITYCIRFCVAICKLVLFSYIYSSEKSWPPLAMKEFKASHFKSQVNCPLSKYNRSHSQFMSFLVICWF